MDVLDGRRRNGPAQPEPGSRVWEGNCQPSIGQAASHTNAIVVNLFFEATQLLGSNISKQQYCEARWNLNDCLWPPCHV